MTIKLYKMSFDHAHFGEGHLNESHAAFDSGRLFSALFIEALKLGEADAFLKEANRETFVLSDALKAVIPTSKGSSPFFITGSCVSNCFCAWAMSSILARCCKKSSN